MLLIGSRAAKYHFPTFRKPKDFDFICTRNEYLAFKNTHSITNEIDKGYKCIVKCISNNKTHNIEFSFAEHGNSAEDILNLHDHHKVYGKTFGITYFIPSVSVLMLLKKSHLSFQVHWKKSMEDYQFFLKTNFLKKEHLPIFYKRFEEAKKFYNKKEMNFKVSNEEFFAKSDNYVKRKHSHDFLHYATCYYDQPLFLSIKEDITKAEISEELFNSLIPDQKIETIQEEAFALSLERFIIPAIEKNEYNPSMAKEAYTKIVKRLITNFLPFWQRLFAIDHYLEILDYKVDYVRRYNEYLKNMNEVMEYYPNEKIFVETF